MTIKKDLKTIWWLVVLSHIDWLATHRKRPLHEHKILVVRLDQIGDFVLWFNSARALRALYPSQKYQITLLGDRLWTALAREQSIFDDVWEMDRNRFAIDPRYRFQLLKQVSDAGFSIAINPTFGRDFLWGDAVIRASRATERIGLAGSLERMSKAGKMLSDRWYTRLVRVSDQARTELERNAEFVHELGATWFRASMPRIEPKQPTPRDIAERDYYLLCPVAGWGIRCWPAQNFARIADLVFAETGWLGVICGGPGDQEVARQLMSATSAPLLNYAGKTTLGETLAMVAAARLTIGNETGVIHLTAAAGTPSICILGGGHYGKFLPYPHLDGSQVARPETISHHMDCFGCNWRCIFSSSRREPAPCITNISVESVWKTTLSILNRIRCEHDNAVARSRTPGPGSRKIS